jgi:hypothetical protein
MWLFFISIVGLFVAVKIVDNLLTRIEHLETMMRAMH